MARVVVLLGMLGLFACAHGNPALQAETRQDIVAKLFTGQTTEQQAQQMFGLPASTSDTEKGDTWTYGFNEHHTEIQSAIPFVQILSSGSSSQGKSLVLVFGPDRILRDWSYTETANSFHRGV